MTDTKRDRSLVARIAGNVVAGVLVEAVAEAGDRDEDEVISAVANLSVRVAEAIVKRVDGDRNALDGRLNALVRVARAVARPAGFHDTACQRDPISKSTTTCDVCIMRDILAEIPS